MSTVSSSLRYLFSFSLSPHISKPKNLLIPRIVSSKNHVFPRSRPHISANFIPFCSISSSKNVAETIDTSIDLKYLSCCMPDKKPLKIAVLLSGGVDSSVALRLLHLAGHSCTAFYLKIWFQVCFPSTSWIIVFGNFICTVLFYLLESSVVTVIHRWSSLMIN